MTRSLRRRVRRTLPLRVETVRQAKRRRTAYALGFLVVLPLILLGAFALAGPGDSQPGQTNLVDLATSGAVNFTIFTVFASGTGMTSTVGQLNSTFSNKFNELRVTYQRERNKRDPGQAFPHIQVDLDTATNLRAGAEL